VTHFREVEAAELAAVEGGSFWDNLWSAISGAISTIVEFFVCIDRPCA
jgi:hypothetical protein